eukprot:gb/GEZN01003840.1/.p1 GENE.gb/GEZN01003840.1/~~gb/GEZN01003840.1/.p1  ORF type:complete len:602 (+),score=104.18 gb/GEZN01003840.1/:49-1854(+)
MAFVVALSEQSLELWEVGNRFKVQDIPVMGPAWDKMASRLLGLPSPFQDGAGDRSRANTRRRANSTRSTKGRSKGSSMGSELEGMEGSARADASRQKGGEGLVPDDPEMHPDLEVVAEGEEDAKKKQQWGSVLSGLGNKKALKSVKSPVKKLEEKAKGDDEEVQAEKGGSALGWAGKRRSVKEMRRMSMTLSSPLQTLEVEGPPETIRVSRFTLSRCGRYLYLSLSQGGLLVWRIVRVKHSMPFLVTTAFTFQPDPLGRLVRPARTMQTPRNVPELTTWSFLLNDLLRLKLSEQELKEQELAARTSLRLLLHNLTRPGQKRLLPEDLPDFDRATRLKWLVMSVLSLPIQSAASAVEVALEIYDEDAWLVKGESRWPAVPVPLTATAGRVNKNNILTTLGQSLRHTEDTDDEMETDEWEVKRDLHAEERIKATQLAKLEAEAQLAEAVEIPMAVGSQGPNTPSNKSTSIGPDAKANLVLAQERVVHLQCPICHKKQACHLPLPDNRGVLKCHFCSKQFRAPPTVVAESEAIRLNNTQLGFMSAPSSPSHGTAPSSPSHGAGTPTNKQKLPASPSHKKNTSSLFAKPRTVSVGGRPRTLSKRK